MSDDLPLHVLIVDDEQYVRDHLAELLSTRSEVESLSKATHGEEAVCTINSENPDLVFLDVKIPTQTGIEVIEEIGPDAMPATVFVTAHDRFAIKAFELAAVDYMLKPFDEARFETAFERALRVVKLKRVEDLAARFQNLLELPSTRFPLSNGSLPEENARSDSVQCCSNEYLERLTVEVRGQIHVVPVEAIRYVTAEDMYVRIHTEETSYLIRRRMYEMEENLDPAQFVRIHRSAIVRLDCIHRLVQRSGSDYVVQLDDAKTLRVSRSRQDDLIQRLEMGGPKPNRPRS